MQINIPFSFLSDMSSITNETDNEMDENQNNNLADKGNQVSKNPVDTEKMTITLLDGHTLQCFPKVELTQPIDNRMRLDTTGQYFSIGRKKTEVAPTPPDLVQAKKFFTDHAFLFLDHREKILRDSRMFLAPVPVHSAIAYTGTSGFNRPTLGVYIEWWLNCIPSIIGRYRKSSWLVYHIAGSPLSGRNHCGIVNQEGECRSESLPGLFSNLWKPFVDINTRYDKAKERYEAYSLEEVVKQLEAYDQGESLTERKVFLLERENVVLRQENIGLRQEIQGVHESNAIRMNTMRRTLLKDYFEGKRDELEAWYADYCKRQEEGKRNLDDLKLQMRQLKHQLRTREITNVFYQRQLTPLKKKIEALQDKLDAMANDVSFDVFSQSCAKNYVTFNDVIDFLNGKLETEFGITTW